MITAIKRSSTIDKNTLEKGLKRSSKGTMKRGQTAIILCLFLILTELEVATQSTKLKVMTIRESSRLNDDSESLWLSGNA